MGNLGSIFDGTPQGSGPKGPDLRVKVEVPRRALGRPEGYRAPIPEVIEVDGRPVRRHTAPEDRQGVVLHLSPQLAERSMLRLRGQGGENPKGRPGDLLIEVVVVDRTPIPWARIGWVLAGLAAAGAAYAGFAL